MAVPELPQLRNGLDQGYVINQRIRPYPLHEFIARTDRPGIFN